MTQTTVTFVTGATTIPGSSGTPSTSTVVTTSQTNAFDAEISTQAQTYYLQQIGIMQTAQKNITASVTAGNAPSTTDVNNFYAALQSLNQWAAMDSVSATGAVQTNSTVPLLGANGVAVSGAAPVNGFNPTNPPGATITTTMDRYMATSLNAVNQSLLAASLQKGQTFDINDPSINATSGLANNSVIGLTTALKEIAAPTNGSTAPDFYGLASALAQSVLNAGGANIIGDAQSGTESIQQALMVDFVSSGNTILNNQMSELNNAINVNQQTLSYLNSLQDLMNQKDPTQFMLQLQNLSTTQLTQTEPGMGGNTFVLPYTNYDNFENSTFNQSITANPTFTVDPGVDPTTGGASTSGSTSLQSIANSNPNAPPLFAGALGNLSDPANQPGFTNITETIINNLTYLQNQIQQNGGGASQSGGLSSSIQTLINDFEPNGQSGTLLQIQNWVEDAQNGTQGQYQNDLSAAVTSSQSFNDTQRENLNEVMFVFEEFYQSAGGLLSSLDQLMQEIGKNAGS
jgi:hypothetical protein